MKHRCKICKNVEKNERCHPSADIYMVCVHISIYGNIGNHEAKVAVKYAKNWKEMGDKVGGLMCT
jgi:hypothetical protein